MMKKHIARLLLVCLLMAICASAFSSCEKADETLTLYVYNWGEYISDGSEGSLDVIGAFEEISGINVNYTNYATNEDMYAKFKSGATSVSGMLTFMLLVHVSNLLLDVYIKFYL